MITWLASYPRSGNTFAVIVLDSQFNIEAHAAYPDGEEAQRAQGVAPPMSYREMAAAPEMYYLKTHEPPQDSWPAIYLVRDGRDVLVSYAHYALQTRQGVAPGSNRPLFLKHLQWMIESHRYFGGWGSHVLAWTRRAAPTAVIKFEDFIVRPVEEMSRAMAELGQDPPLAPRRGVPSFDKLHQTAPAMFRSGKTGVWKDEMPKALQVLFWRYHGEAMAEVGYGKSNGEGKPAWGAFWLALWAMRRTGLKAKKSGSGKAAFESSARRTSGTMPNMP